MIERLLPTVIKSAAVKGADDALSLYPEEAVQVLAAVDSRKREFARGRFCARQALQKLGLPASSILRGRDREPLWPQGVVGSITHCRGYCAAAVASELDMLAIGIDAETHDELPDDVRQMVAKHERAWLAGAPVGIHWDRVLFSAKESIYKAWFPLTRIWLDFDDVVVTLNPERGTFSARLILHGTPASEHQLFGFVGRFEVSEELVVTAVTLSREELRKSFS